MCTWGEARIPSLYTLQSDLGQYNVVSHFTHLHDIMELIFPDFTQLLVQHLYICFRMINNVLKDKETEFSIFKSTSSTFRETLE